MSLFIAAKVLLRRPQFLRSKPFTPSAARIVNLQRFPSSTHASTFTPLSRPTSIILLNKPLHLSRLFKLPPKSPRRPSTQSSKSRKLPFMHEPPHRAFHTTRSTPFFASSSHNSSIVTRITEIIPLHECLFWSLVAFTALSPTILHHHPRLPDWLRSPRLHSARRYLRSYFLVSSTAFLGLMALSMLETTQNENRARLLSRPPEYPYPDATELEQIRREIEKPMVVKDPKDPRVRRAQLSLAKLLRGVEDDGIRLKAYPPLDAELERLLGERLREEEDPDRALQQENARFGDRPFRIHVTEDRNELACSFVGRNIVVGPACFDYEEHDPRFLDVVIAHELGHLVQEHYLEARGSGQLANGIESFLTGAAYYLRAISWGLFRRLGPFVNGAWEVHQEKLIHRAVLGPCNQSLEHEADRLSIKLLVRAGCDPRVVPAFWRWNEWNLRQKQIHLAGWEANSAKSKEEGTVLSKCTAKMESWLNATHPSHKERAESMTKVAEEIREQWVETERRKQEYLETVNARTAK
ncbi:hypothetical protein MVEG_02340 [Podila verticillata NRRL 6337]|nr:hypothetical protein MVEG_02340 [Podila verticillata NRRL 6337]